MFYGRPEIAAATALSEVPAARLCVDVWFPYEALRPYSKYQLVGCPFGLTCPLSTAEFLFTELADPVVASGAVGPGGGGGGGGGALSATMLGVGVSGRTPPSTRMLYVACWRRASDESVRGWS